MMQVGFSMSGTDVRDNARVRSERSHLNMSDNVITGFGGERRGARECALERPEPCGTRGVELAVGRSAVMSVQE